MKPSAASGIRVEMACPAEWRQAGDWEPWPTAWNRMGLTANELAVLTALLSATWSDDLFNDEPGLQKAAGLARNKLREALRALEGRGLLTRPRAAVRGNGKRYVLYREPIPEDERTAAPPETQQPTRRRRNADKLTGSMTGRPVPEGASEGSDQNPSAADDSGSMTGRPVPEGSMTGRPGGSTTGRPVALPIQMSSDTSSSSVGSSSTADVEPGLKEEEEASEEAETTNSDWESVARDLVGGVRFKPGRYLMREARERVVELLIGHLEAGHQPSWLEKRLNEWGNEAKNPSTYFVERLEGLGPPRPKLTVVADQQPEPERDQAREPDAAGETSETPPPSPVTWLSDAQFTQLPQALRAAVRTIGEQPESELSPIAQTWYASIRASLGSEEIADKGA